jgi:hypothetical protein
MLCITNISGGKMKMRSHSIHLILTFVCILSIASSSGVFAQEFARDFTLTGEGSGSVGFNVPEGTFIDVLFDIISITGDVSIEGTDFSESFSSDSGSISGGPFEVTLEPGEYILTETYSATVASTNGILINVGGNTVETTFERAISVASTATYTIGINTVLRDVSLGVEGELISGQTRVDGVVGDQIEIQIMAKEFIEADTPIESVKTTSGTVVSNTSLVISKDFTITGEGSGSLSFNVPEGTFIDVLFDIISITGEATIEGTDFSESFSSDTGSIDGGPFEVTLEPGEYILTEIYSATVASTNGI